MSLITNDIRNPKTSLPVLLGRWRDRLRMRSAAVRFEGTSNSSFTGSWTHIKVYQIELASWRNSKRRTRAIYYRWGPIQKKGRLTLHIPTNNRKLKKNEATSTPPPVRSISSSSLLLPFYVYRVDFNLNGHTRGFTSTQTTFRSTRRFLPLTMVQEGWWAVGGGGGGCWIRNSSLGFRSVKDNSRINLHWLDTPELVPQENITFC